MYATCLFCSGALGRNESLEHFPVGRRLAFDAAKGRLWVICSHCARWNLTPLDARWEAIEQAERLYRDTRRRVSTEHVGLATLHDGTALVRIGRPLLPEFAAWRYGSVFANRWRKSLAIGAAVLSIPVIRVGMMVTDSVGAFSSMLVTAGLVHQLGTNAINSYRWRRIRAAIPDAQGNRCLVSRMDVSESSIRYDDGWHISLQHRAHPRAGGLLQAGLSKLPLKRAGVVTLEGDAAARAVSALLPLANHGGARKKTVSEAVTLIAASPSLDGMLSATRPAIGWAGYGAPATEMYSLVSTIPSVVRLALEMRLHEAEERSALEGELHALEDRWREAEEIAAIADRLFLPPDIEERLATLRRR